MSVSNEIKQSKDFEYLEVLEYDTVICAIWFSYKLRKVYFENYSDNILFLPFGCKDTATFKDFEEFLEGRCFPKARFGKKELLKAMNLDYYDPYDIIQVTHGLVYGDYLWLRFKGEALKYNDVKVCD